MKQIEELVLLDLEVPAVMTDKEGQLRGGFCGVATFGEDLLSVQALNLGCSTNKGCTQNDRCSVNSECQVSPAPTTTTTATPTPSGEASVASLLGCSLMF